MDPHADRLARSEPYANDELPRFVSLADLEPAEITVTPAAIPCGGGSTTPADTPPMPGGQYSGASFSDVASPPQPQHYRGGSITPAERWAVARAECREAVADLSRELRETIADINRDERLVELKVSHAKSDASRTRIVASQRPRTRGRESHRGQAGHRRTTSSRAGPSSDSDSDGPGEAGPPTRRRVVVDSQYVVVGIVST